MSKHPGLGYNSFPFTPVGIAADSPNAFSTTTNFNKPTLFNASKPPPPVPVREQTEAVSTAFYTDVPPLVQDFSAISEDKDVLLATKPSLIDDFLTEGVSLPSWTGFGPLLVGSAVSNLFQNFNSSANVRFALDNQFGTGSLNNTFDLGARIQNQENYNNTITNIQSAEVSIGSAFGPEGLIAGTALAAVTGVVGNMFSPSQVTEQGNSGNLVNSSDTYSQSTGSIQDNGGNS